MINSVRDRIKIKRYIKNALRKGYNKEQIIETMEKINWKREDIEELFNDIKKKKFNITIETPSKPPEEVIKPEVTIEPKRLGLRDQMANIEEKMETIIQSGRTKKGKSYYKMPNKVRRQLKTLAEKGKVIVIYLKNNRDLTITTSKIQRGAIEIEGKWRNCTADFVFLWRGKIPTIILPEWDLNPIGTDDYYKAIKEKRIATPQDVILRMIELKENEEKKKLSPKAWIWILLALAAGAYVLFSGK